MLDHIKPERTEYSDEQIELQLYGYNNPKPQESELCSVDQVFSECQVFPESEVYLENYASQESQVCSETQGCSESELFSENHVCSKAKVYPESLQNILDLTAKGIRGKNLIQYCDLDGVCRSTSKLKRRELWRGIDKPYSVDYATGLKGYYGPAYYPTLENINAIRYLNDLALKATTEEEVKLEDSKDFEKHCAQFHPNVLKEIIKNIGYIQIVEEQNGEDICIPFSVLKALLENNVEELQGELRFLFSRQDLMRYKSVDDKGDPVTGQDLLDFYKDNGCAIDIEIDDRGEFPQADSLHGIVFGANGFMSKISGPKSEIFPDGHRIFPLKEDDDKVLIPQLVKTSETTLPYTNNYLLSDPKYIDMDNKTGEEIERDSTNLRENISKTFMLDYYRPLFVYLGVDFDVFTKDFDINQLKGKIDELKVKLEQTSAYLDVSIDIASRRSELFNKIKSIFNLENYPDSGSYEDYKQALEYFLELFSADASFTQTITAS